MQVDFILECSSWKQKCRWSRSNCQVNLWLAYYCINKLNSATAFWHVILILIGSHPFLFPLPANRKHFVTVCQKSTSNCLMFPLKRKLLSIITSPFVNRLLSWGTEPTPVLIRKKHNYQSPCYKNTHVWTLVLPQQ